MLWFRLRLSRKGGNSGARGKPIQGETQNLVLGVSRRLLLPVLVEVGWGIVV